MTERASILLILFLMALGFALFGFGIYQVQNYNKCQAHCNPYAAKVLAGQCLCRDADNSWVEFEK